MDTFNKVFENASNLTVKGYLAMMTKKEIGELMSLSYREAMEKFEWLRETRPPKAVLDYLMVEMFLDKNNDVVINRMKQTVKDLDAENDEIRQAGDRNAAKMTMVARKNREYINQLKIKDEQIENLQLDKETLTRDYELQLADKCV